MHVEKRNAFTFVAGHWQKKDWQKTKFNLRHFELIQKICRSTFIFIINSPSRGVKNASRVTFFSLFVRKKRRKNGGQQCAMKARNGNASWFYEKIYSFFFSTTSFFPDAKLTNSISTGHLCFLRRHRISMALNQKRKNTTHARVSK